MNIDLFGALSVTIPKVSSKKNNLFGDHEAFVKKFEAKKTTDDCYTPPLVYDVILGHINDRYFPLYGKNIVRPFYPDGDFEAVYYGENDVVIDNPPFSIVSKITRFYVARNIPFFIFAPHLTLFSSDIDCTHIVCGSDIMYENGAVVKTSFLTNMAGSAKIIGDADLFKKLKDVAPKEPERPVYVYPPNVVTVSQIAYLVEKGVSISIDKCDARHCRGLHSQRAHGKTIFGSGFLISNQAAAEKAAAEKAATEKAAAEKAAAIIWELSRKEMEIIKTLG